MARRVEHYRTYGDVQGRKMGSSGICRKCGKGIRCGDKALELKVHWKMKIFLHPACAIAMHRDIMDAMSDMMSEHELARLVIQEGQDREEE